MAFALPGRLLWVLVTLLPIVIALGAIWGDLLESSIKREFGVKDAGTWLPGFGGLLDRIDSLIIVVPLAFYFLRVAG
jgi:phosphatidate cytidylyltransferase